MMFKDFEYFRHDQFMSCKLHQVGRQGVCKTIKLYKAVAVNKEKVSILLFPVVQTLTGCFL